MERSAERSAFQRIRRSVGNLSDVYSAYVKFLRDIGKLSQIIFDLNDCLLSGADLNKIRFLSKKFWALIWKNIEFCIGSSKSFNIVCENNYHSKCKQKGITCGCPAQVLINEIMLHLFSLELVYFLFLINMDDPNFVEAIKKRFERNMKYIEQCPQLKKIASWIDPSVMMFYFQVAWCEIKTTKGGAFICRSNFLDGGINRISRNYKILKTLLN